MPHNLALFAGFEKVLELASTHREVDVPSFQNRVIVPLYLKA